MTDNRVLINDKGHIFVNEIIVGCTPQSLAFAEEKRLPMVFTSQDYPNFFEEDTLEEFTDRCFHLSTIGMIPFGDKIERMRVDTNLQVLSIFCGPKKYDLFYEKLYIFSDKEVDGLPEPTSKNSKYKVLDWLDLNSTTKELNPISTDSDFVKSIYFYPSLRTARRGFPDAVAVSYMSQEQLSDPDMCDTYARLKSINLMREAGIGGTKMGSGRRRPLTVSHSHREVIPVSKNEYENIPNIEFK